MFGSRKDDEKKAKRSFWPWGRRSRDEVSEEQVEAKAEPEVEDVVSTVETPEAVAESASESSAVVDAAPETVPEAVQGTEDKPVHPESREESAYKAPEASDKEVPVVAAPEIPRVAEPESPPEKTPVEPEDKPEAKGGFFARMRQGLSKTRNVLVEGVAELFIGKKEIDDDLLDELETQLLVADVGVEATTDIIEKLTRKVKYKELDDADALMAALQSELADILVPADQPLVIPQQDTPFVILVVGVNGVGKTTTIGKLARKLQSEGRKVMLAAGDTFRAAAVEQLQVWGERNEIPVVAQHTGADSASVIFDAFEAARARNIDVLIADTAGRLHNKDHLMEELKKVKRVLGKLDPDAPHEVLLVLDAGTGQNALSQARLFHETVQLTGMALTKLDGTAKGGVIFALSKQMKLPIRFLGVGEQIDDLRPFSAKEFVKALFSREG
ncbi:signal recognition particle-docking protein FtsY [Endozoicomonas sp. GU-1]|uniref:signal recognition particle-docking protein FtsY n=1 Tax=Endozoicomonas sp. GU-1 TaxID=3009078 RepID=UPI0022B43131|nr:signal recognition particle-docking protein FtsY [Endozoicomonas sp. GU-1]WBA82575.1 signal recognition particle-docking protein FtsY [Endozoicomonas sp. GU-1]WBA85504.1 signal recognition particle-docking protein FtsY [Endozoicomonas sp. GU-1]